MWSFAGLTFQMVAAYRILRCSDVISSIIHVNPAVPDSLVPQDPRFFMVDFDWTKNLHRTVDPLDVVVAQRHGAGEV